MPRPFRCRPAPGRIRPLGAAAVPLAIGLALATTVALPACGPGASPADRPDILLLSIDTLRGDRWGCLGDPATRTPWMDRLARRGTLAFEGRAPAPVTLPSHTSLHTGLSPASHGVRDNGIFRMPADQGQLLAESLAGAGWTTAAFVSAYPLTKTFGLDRGFVRYDSNLGELDGDLGGMRQRPAGETVDRTLNWLGGGRGDSPAPDVPTFVWVHVFDPHAEYEPPGPWAASHAGDPYRGEVAYVDSQAGRLLRGWTAQRAGRTPLIAIVSDHGEGLHEHGESTHGALLHATTLRIPLVVATPDYAPRLIAEPMPLERIPATVLDRVGLPPRLNDGSAPTQDAPAGPVHGETLYPFYNFGWAGLRVREADGWRLIDGPAPRLYHLAVDPGETRDVAADHPERVTAMRADLEHEWERRLAVALAAEAREVSDEDLEALRALGYVGGGGASEPAEVAFTRGADPHARLVFVDRINQALTFLSHGDADRAVTALRAVVAEDPENRFAYQYLGQAAMQAGRLPEA
ncbi:MAG: sulfatase-like hydrolase/transferase, partial [Gemmatimonadetes bacterium]|nr:sulfatase-like hydrolase/transferase [Gemmatimonadota bacterium]